MPESTSPAPRATPAPDAAPAFFDNPTLDHLIGVTLELGAELWVQRERLRLVERLLAERGLVTAEMLEQYRPDEAQLAASRAERDAFISRVYGQFSRETVAATPTAATD